MRVVCAACLPQERHKKTERSFQWSRGDRLRPVFPRRSRIAVDKRNRMWDNWMSARRTATSAPIGVRPSQAATEADSEEV